MLQRLRSRPRFSAVITAVFALLLLVASLAGVQVRVLAQPMAAVLAADICSVNAPVQDVARVHADHSIADDLLPEGRDSHSDHAAHGADCVLCIAMALPLAFAADVHRPAAPAFHQQWQAQAAHSPLAPGAPLPARGPPLIFV
ncbi:hypothetical protein HS961_12310 [Comamonas piscis]|uniref:DUF2946 domain-containing protein n=1 Tax=Comamonas piscis TaxID=1562974 RepID=A0A7G5EHS1_9BURK|nr:DUF2946 family protein [Comamonas piscis]QMV73546.1 hypothetical protein HS961_12310 [Comamonas piscis]WSO31964.1 DUF2946 family protein [Comamonas piscis]